MKFDIFIYIRFEFGKIPKLEDWIGKEAYMVNRQLKNLKATDMLVKGIASRIPFVKCLTL